MRSVVAAVPECAREKATGPGPPARSYGLLVTPLCGFPKETAYGRRVRPNGTVPDRVVCAHADGAVTESARIAKLFPIRNG
ncbi:hypothetical protein Amsp01_012300 [Amycolatopsis sp. NBRC 101858]|nr:hypothetical protein Amsp01_012300 [Amycolatopsis sp. NBRC 101858]